MEATFRSLSTTKEGVLQDLNDYVMTNMAGKGLVPSSVGVTKSTSDGPISDPEDILNNVFRFMGKQKDRQGGAALDASDTPVQDSYRQRRYDFISREEGNRQWAYDDATSRRITDVAQKQGYVTVGVGFNMDRPGARDTFTKALGPVDFDAVYSGKASLTPSQVQKLFDYTSQEAEAYVARKFQGVNITEHQRLALVSLAFNNPSLVGPKLTAAVTGGDTKAALAEILYNSNRTQHKGLASRRYREAAMFAGSMDATKFLPGFEEYMAKFA